MFVSCQYVLIPKLGDMIVVAWLQYEHFHLKGSIEYLV